MVHYCCVKNCKNVWNPNNNLSFHKFPWSNPSLLNSWLNVVPCRNHNVNQSSRICSDHFTQNDYENNMGIIRRLKKNVVPRNFPSDELSNASYVPSDCSQNNDLTQRNCTNNLSQLSEDSQHPTTSEIFQEHNYHLPSTVETDQQITDSAQNKILKDKENYQKKIKTLQKQLQRKHQKLEKLYNVIRLLKSECNCSEALEKELNKIL